MVLTICCVAPVVLCSQAKPKDLSDEQFMDQINDTLIKVAGLDAQLDGGDSGDEGKGQAEGTAQRPL
jgi:hypothetical protein